MNKKFYIVASVGMAILLYPGVLFAQNNQNQQINYEFLAPLPGLQANQGNDIVGYLGTAVTILIGIAGILAVIRMVICGFELLMAPNPGQRSHARECVWKAVLGLLLAISAFILLQAINPVLNNIQFNPPQIPVNLNPNGGGGLGGGGGGNQVPPQGSWCFDVTDVCTQLNTQQCFGANGAQCGMTFANISVIRRYNNLSNCAFGNFNDECFSAVDTCRGIVVQFCFQAGTGECDQNRAQQAIALRYTPVAACRMI